MSTIRLAAHSNTYKCELEFKHRINIIIGDSGVGKTSLVEIFATEGAVKDRESTYPVLPADISNYEAIFIGGENQIIIMDDICAVETEEFAKLVEENLVPKNLYLIIISRADMPELL